MLNLLAGMLTGIRAFEAELEAESDGSEEVREIVADYVPRLVEMVNEVTSMMRRQL